MTGNKTVFITGASGFLGNHVLHELASTGYSVYALTRRDFSVRMEGLPSSVKFIKGDIFSLPGHMHLIGQCSCFIHLAGEKQNEKDMFRVNVGGMDAVIGVVSKIKGIRVLYCSSSGVFGIENNPEKCITENSPCFPLNEYEKTKLEAERLLNNKAEFPFTTIRPSNVFGEQDPSRKLLTLIRQIKKRRFAYINRSSMLNYVYVKHVAETTRIILQQELFENQTYILNSPCTIQEFAGKIMQVLDVRYEPFALPAALLYPLALAGEALPLRYRFFNKGKYRELTSEKYYSPAKIETLLSLNGKESLFRGLENLIAYYRENKWL